jgi:hypothetical protein
MEFKEMPMPEHENQRNRNIDRWLLYWRPAELIITFMLGLCSGVVVTALLYRDHEKRIASYEKWKVDHDIADNEYKEKTDTRIKSLEKHTSQVSTFLEDRFHVHIP